MNNHKYRCNRSLKWTITYLHGRDPDKRYYYCPSCLLSKEYCHCKKLELPNPDFLNHKEFYDMLENKDQ
jgi:late competence protein required for DNA uptake (superfamily II DNA/RNA helicase)